MIIVSVIINSYFKDWFKLSRTVYVKNFFKAYGISKLYLYDDNNIIIFKMFKTYL